jgi:hypothetical protein
LFLPDKGLDFSFAGWFCPLGPCDIAVGIAGDYLSMGFIGVASRVVEDDGLFDIQIALIEDERLFVIQKPGEVAFRIYLLIFTYR